MLLCNWYFSRGCRKDRHTRRNYISSEFCIKQYFFPISPSGLYLLLRFIFVLIISGNIQGTLFTTLLPSYRFYSFLKICLMCVLTFSFPNLSFSHPTNTMSQCPRLEQYFYESGLNFPWLYQSLKCSCPLSAPSHSPFRGKGNYLPGKLGNRKWAHRGPSPFLMGLSCSLKECILFWFSMLQNLQH